MYILTYCGFLNVEASLQGFLKIERTQYNEDTPKLITYYLKRSEAATGGVL